MAAGERSRYGSGLYKRGAVWWVRVRTSVALKKNISRSLWRFSLGASSSTQASVTARFVRAALDRGFAMVGVWAGERVLDTAQMEAILGQLARQALAEAETLRALPCARSEADVSVAKAAHLRAAAGWREALRLNDLTAAAPLVMAAADAVGLAGPGAARENRLWSTEQPGSMDYPGNGATVPRARRRPWQDDRAGTTARHSRREWRWPQFRARRR